MIMQRSDETNYNAYSRMFQNWEAVAVETVLPKYASSIFVVVAVVVDEDDDDVVLLEYNNIYQNNINAKKCAWLHKVLVLKYFYRTCEVNGLIMTWWKLTGPAH